MIEIEMAVFINSLVDFVLFIRAHDGSERTTCTRYGCSVEQMP